MKWVPDDLELSGLAVENLDPERDRGALMGDRPSSGMLLWDSWPEIVYVSFRKSVSDTVTTWRDSEGNVTRIKMVGVGIDRPGAVVQSHIRGLRCSRIELRGDEGVGARSNFGLGSGQPMAVQVARDAAVGVAHIGADRLDVGAGSDQQRGVAVAALMQREPPNPAPVCVDRPAS